MDLSQFLDKFLFSTSCSCCLVLLLLLLLNAAAAAAAAAASHACWLLQVCLLAAASPFLPSSSLTRSPLRRPGSADMEEHSVLQTCCFEVVQKLKRKSKLVE